VPPIFKSAILCMADFRELGVCGLHRNPIILHKNPIILHRNPIILHINLVFLTPVKLCDWSTRFMRVISLGLSSVKPVLQ